MAKHQLSAEVIAEIRQQRDNHASSVTQADEMIAAGQAQRARQIVLRDQYDALLADVEELPAQ